jgi:hypothetical protein
MNQPLRVLQELGEQIHQTVANDTRPKRRLPISRWTGRQANQAIAGLGTALAIAVALLIAGGAIVLLNRSSTPVGHAAAAVNPEITAHFAAFRRPRLASDAVPSGLRFECESGGDALGAFCFVDQHTSGRTAIFRSEIPSALQLDQSRRFTLPGGLGFVWLIPAHRSLCALIRMPYAFFFKPFPGTMVCRSAAQLVARPPLIWPGYFLAPDTGKVRHGYLIAIEPDRVTRATITYPGGREPTILHQGLLLGCVGIGPYRLLQDASTGRSPAPIGVGGVGKFSPVTCPQFGLAANARPQNHSAAASTTPTVRSNSNPVVDDCLAHGRLTQPYTKPQLRSALRAITPAVRKYTNCPALISTRLRQ